jgi:uncharacterized protein Yka (UPF0111/DUF47 family)
MDISNDGQIKAKRDAAERARKLAWGLGTPADREAILRFAAELDAQADALEQQAATLPAPPRVVIQMQRQQQQQQQQGQSKKDDGEDDQQS